MALKKCILLLSLLLLPAAALAEEEGTTYVIRKGDTLWGLSERFIKDPYYWPSLWSNNPGITNPHFIYPGQKVRFIDGRLEIVPAATEEPATPVAQPSAPPVETTPPPPPSPAPEAITLRLPGKVEGFIAADDLSASGTVIDAVDNRLMLATGDLVFTEMTDLQATRNGDRFSLVHLGEDVLHPITNQRIGVRVVDVGELTVEEIHPGVATGRITAATREVQRGARLVPWLPPVREIALKKARQPATGYLVAGGGGQISLGQHDIIYVDLGAANGLETGNLLYLSRPRQASDVSIRENLQLPDVLLGSAVVIDVRAKTASALVLKSTGPLHRGDRVTAARE